MKIRLVTPGGASAIWPRVEDFVKRGCDKSDGELNPFTLKHLVTNGRFGLWVAEDDSRVRMVAVVKMERWRDGVVARIVTIAGDDMKNFLPMWGDFKQMLKKRGASRVLLEGRMGWLRVCPDLKLTRIVAMAEL